MGERRWDTETLDEVSRIVDELEDEWGSWRDWRMHPGTDAADGVCHVLRLLRAKLDEMGAGKVVDDG